MENKKFTIYELCKGGSCCPVIVVYEDGVITLKEGEMEISLQREHLESLRDVIDILLNE